jgi:hypothetical protein
MVVLGVSRQSALGHRISLNIRLNRHRRIAKIAVRHETSHEASAVHVWFAPPWREIRS